MNNMTSTYDAGQAAAPVTQIKPKRRFLKRLGYVGLALLAVLAIAHVAWTGSGSNEWKLAMDKDGIKVWTLKTPGSPLLKIKATTRLDSKLSGMVRLLEGADSCADAQCYDEKQIERIASLPDRFASYLTFKFDIPGFKTRQYVLFQEHYQDPASKVLQLNLLAAPNKLPSDPCCVRITHLHNSWKLTPLPNGKLDVEFMQDTDIGGLPYPMANPALIYGTHEILKSMQALMNKEKYRNAEVNYIQELAQN